MFAVLTSSSLPPGIRGAVNKWMVEVQPGTFVGTMSKRVRDEVWNEVSSWIEEGSDPAAYAAMVEAAPTEQGFALRTAGNDSYEVVDLQGIQLVQRHHKQRLAAASDILPDPNW